MSREFLVDINPNVELPKYELILYQLMGLPLTSLKNITNFNYKALFIGIDEINFNIPAYRNENDGTKVRNEIYDMVDGEYYILLNDKKYFIINKIDEKSDSDGNTYKEVHAYSREFELSQKYLVDYKADSRVLYDDTNSMLEGLEKGVLNYIFNHVTKSWTIGYVDINLTLNTVHRSLDFPKTNLIQVFQELQKIFNCVFMFDTINQKIDIYSMDTELGQDKGLYISNRNFIKSLSKNIEYDKVKTRLYVYGKDNVSLQSISPTGQPFLDNFDIFKNTKFMTQGLIDALNSYQQKVDNYNPDFKPLLTQLQNTNAEMEELINADHPSDLNQKGLVALERALSNTQTLIDVKIEELAIIRNTIANATGTDLESLYNDMKTIQSALDGYESEKSNINTLIDNKKAEIDAQQVKIDGIKQQISDLQYVLDMSNPDNFTVEQLKELDKFIRIETYNDSNFTENNITELYEEGKKLLARISQPPIQFDVDVVDFLSLVECQHVWKKFVLGDTVTLEHREIGFDFKVRLVGYEHDTDNNSLKLKFSNTYSFDDDTLWLRDLLEEINTTATAVDFNKYKWDKTDSIESKIAKMVDAKLEEARQSILNAVGQRHLFDDTGLWLYKENPDGSINPEQIRSTNNTIALTTDNWISPPVWALDPTGINAEIIRGKLGQFAKVSADQIEVGMNEQPLLDYIDEFGNAITVHQILLSNENQSIVTDSNGITTTPMTIQSNIDVYRGVTKVDATIGTPTLKDKDGNSINFGTITKTNPTTITSGSVKWTIPSNTNISSESGWIEIPISVVENGQTYSYVKKLTWNKARAGAKGDTGASAYTVILTNESQNFSANSSGVISTEITATTSVVAYKGTNPITPTIGNLPTISGLTISKSGTTITIKANTGSSLAKEGSFDIPIDVDGNTFTKKFTWTKVNAGVDGVGQDAKSVDLTGSQVFKYNKGSSTPTQTSITFTATKQNITSNTFTWHYSIDGGQTFNVISGATSSTYALTYNNSMWSSYESIVLKVSIDGVSDTISVYRIRDGNDGNNAKLLYLSTSAETMTFDSSGNPKPTSQTITFTANLQNMSGVATFTATPYNSSGTALTTITLGGSGNIRTLTQAQWLSTYSKLTVTATLDGLTDTVTIVRLQDALDGNKGKDAIVGYLTNESVTLSANSSGVVSNFTPATGTFKVFDGLVDKTGTSVTYNKTSNTNCVAAINTSGVYSVSSMSEDTATAIFTATYGGVTITKTLSLSKSRAGDKGDSAIVGVLSNNSHTVPTDSSGNNGNYTGCSTTMSIYVGSTNDSANWTVTAAASSGITGSLSGKTYTVTNMDMTTDTGYVDLTAKRSGYADIIMRFNISKNKQGGIGQSATAYWLVTDVSVINKSQTGVYTPASLNISAKSQVGTSSPSTYAGRFIIAETTNGTNYINKYTSSANENSKSYTPSAGIKAIRIRLYLAGGVSNLIDEEIIPIVLDGSNAKIITITASHDSFISKSTESPIPASSYLPTSIMLTPTPQNCEYDKWYYSLDGNEFTPVTSGQDGLTISSNKLSVANNSLLYNNQNFIIFKVVSTTGEYDIITIPRIYDSTTLAQNALKQNFYYNRTKITEDEGIEVYDNLGNRVLQMGGIATGATQTKNDYGFKASHSDGTFSALVRDGFIRKYPHGDATYMNNLYVTTITTADPGIISTNKPEIATHYLPLSFKGQSPSIIPVVKSFVTDWFDLEETSDSRATGATSDIIVNISEFMNEETPYITIEGYVKNSYTALNQSYNSTTYSGLEIVILIMMA